LKYFEGFSIIVIIKDAQDIELYQARLFCLILIFFHFGFSKWIFIKNGMKEVSWFKNTRFQSLNSKPTFLSVIIGTIMPYIRRFSFARIFYGI
jgi:hypothetical protein